MDLFFQILSIVLVLFAFTGVLYTIAILAIIIMIHNGGSVQIGYQDDDSDEIIKTNNNEE